MRVLLGMLCLLLGLIRAASAQEVLDVSLHEEIVQLPVAALATGEEPRQIVATLFRPDGAGPFPLLVLSHGNPPSAADRPRIGRYRQIVQIREFVQRGYAVIVPIRRGYGASGGDYAESYARCSSNEFFRAGMEAARDVLAALAYARTLPWVRTEGTVLAGQSAGGFASIAAASLQPAGVVAVLNFSGGRGGDPVKHPAVPCGEGAMAATFARFGASTRVPVLFHYVENDQFFGPDYTRSWFEAFEQAGGRGRFVLQPAYGKDGHGLFASKGATQIWSREVDAFLAAL
ncbi:S9 family peptidase [Uliginosibacterium sp. TH139]|uniref:alpha/beta hydrolase family protein n=1 Tax=Uliginosibacterium sp. TH139 TaxID=2067453 RepID=UPI001304303E|nr:alpha/beta fold hydrolase [Uliginosibacterium sp. TH139]